MLSKSTLSTLTLSLALAMGTVACGDAAETALDALGGNKDATPGGTGGSGGLPDAGGTPDTGGGTPDTGSGSAYKFIAIVDGEEPVCTGTGPGADIDSVSLSRAGAVVGVGLTGSATWSETFPGHTSSPCSMCGAGMCPHSGTTTAERVTGARDARSYASMPDTGYSSLNTGAIWLQIGSATGSGTAQDIKSGDKLTVNEVDLTYKADMSAFDGCSCLPEKYQVWAYVTKGDATTRVQLIPTAYRTANTTCGAVSATDKNGCGTTDFMVP